MMKNARLGRVLCLLSLFLFINVPGFCLFRDDADPQEVKSKIMFQRQKDKQRRQEYEQRKKTEERERSRTRQKTPERKYVQPTQKKEIPKKGAAKAKAQAEPQQNSQYKRLSRQAKPIIRKQLEASPVPVKSPPPPARKQPSTMRTIFLLVILVGLIGFLFYKRRKEKNRIEL